MRVCNEDCLPVGINRCNAAPTPTGFAEIVSDYFPVFFTAAICPMRLAVRLWLVFPVPADVRDMSESGERGAKQKAATRAKRDG